MNRNNLNLQRMLAWVSTLMLLGATAGFAAESARGQPPMPAINVEVFPKNVTVCEGEAVTFTFVTRMVGGFEGLQLRNVFVDSTLCDSIEFVGGDLDGNGHLDFGEEFTNQCTIVFFESQKLHVVDGADLYFLGQFVGTVFGEDSAEITVIDCEAGCTYTIGFWKTHPDAWPVDEITIGENVYSKEEALRILWQPVRGDASIILAYQFIAATLNVAAGASPDAIAAELAVAEALLAADPPGSRPTGEARHEAISLADNLDAYNNGWTGPGHCD